MSDAAKLPPVIRAKFEMPVAAGSFAGGTPSSEMVTIATKKVLIARPWTSRGSMKCQ